MMFLFSISSLMKKYTVINSFVNSKKIDFFLFTYDYFLFFDYLNYSQYFKLFNLYLLFI